MKIITALCASVLLAYVVITVSPVNGEEAIYSDMIRLHVLADSDETNEQELKLKVRDAVLEKVTELTNGITDTEEALSVVENNLEEISKVGKTVVENNGYDHNVTAEIGREDLQEGKAGAAQQVSDLRKDGHLGLHDRRKGRGGQLV